MNSLKKTTSLFLIPLLLVGFWLFMSLFFASNYSLSVFVNGYGQSNIKNFNTNELLKGQKIIGSFKSKENNLGIVGVRFFNFDNISQDIVTFRIKENPSKNWYYVHSYKVDQFQPNELFTFGFPIITNSKNKNYTFEIQSQKGKPGNAIALSSLSPTFVTEFQFTKSELLANKTRIPIFLIKKIFYSFSDINFAVSSSIYLLPLILYLVWLFFRKSLLVSQNYILVEVFLLGVLTFVFFMQQINRDVELTLIILWIFLVIFYRLESSVSFLLALAFLILVPFLLIFNLNLIAENSSMWTYFFLVIGTFQAAIEYRKKPGNLLTYDKFLQKIFGSYLSKKYFFLSTKFKSLLS